MEAYMSTEVVTTKEEKPMEYIPFGGQDKIKLTVAIVQNLICVKTKSGKVCSAQDAIKFMMLCQARKLNPFEGDAYLIGYEGRDGPAFSLITAHQAFLKRAEVNAEYDGMKSGIIVEEDEQLKDLEGDFYTNGQKVVGGWATVYFKNRKQPMHKRIRLERFRKSFGVWMDDAAGMICKCAEADALRSSFPTMLGGLYIKEETSPQQPLFETTAPIFREPEKKAKKADHEPEPPQESEYTPEVEPEPTTKPPKAVKKAPEPPKADPEPSSEPPPPQKPAEKPPEPPASPVEQRVKIVTNQLAVSGIKEPQLIGFLRDMGVIDGDVTTLAMVGEKSPDVLELISEQYADIVSRIRANGGGK
jgi:phage recombination protein Bet